MYIIHGIYCMFANRRPQLKTRVSEADVKGTDKQSHPAVPGDVITCPALDTCFWQTKSQFQLYTSERRFGNAMRFSLNVILLKKHIKLSNKTDAIILTHCGIVSPHDDTKLGYHWFKQWLLAWLHQAITWNNVDLPSVRSFSAHARVMCTWVFKISIHKLC